MASTQEKNTTNQAAPIDLNSLHTPHKLAAFIVNVPSRKQEFSFLFNEENNNNNNNTNQQQQSQQFMNKNNNTNLKPPSMIKKHHKFKSSKKKQHKKKSKAHKKLKQQQQEEKHKHLNKDEEDMMDLYDPQNDSVGPNNNNDGFKYTEQYKKEIHSNTSTTNLPNSPHSHESSKTNVFGQRKGKKQRPGQYQLTENDINNNNNNNNKKNESLIKPKLPNNNNNNNNNTDPVIGQDITSLNTDKLQSHHRLSTISASSLNNKSFEEIPDPSSIEVIGGIPSPIEPVMVSSRFESDISSNPAPPETLKYTVSMVGATSSDFGGMPTMPNYSINDVKMPSVGGGGALDTANDSLLTLDDDNDDNEVKQIEITSINNNNNNNNNNIDDGDDIDLTDDLLSESESMDYDESTEEDDEDEYDEYDSDEIEYGRMNELQPQEEERNICIRIAKVLYENSWTGEMISSSTEFSRREYNALLDVGNVPTDSFISNLVWKIIFYSQKKTKDDLINEDKKHIKWYWWDSNDIDSDWKWRKYNVCICQWITEEYQQYLFQNNLNIINQKSKQINFKQCQQKLEKEHEKNKKKRRNNNNDDDDDDNDDDEKKEYLSDNNGDNDNDKNNTKKNKKISIDPYFDKNNNYDHFLIIEKDVLWHQITNNRNNQFDINDGLQYYREIRLDHKLFGVKQEMIINNYQPNPSPFAIPPQLAAVDS